ncbi:S-layer homology domain-containing protein [Caldibacillus thermoamylovorans]|nr:S-layer homology domain-containing protein [Caldibacillus thermoamylovorans]
MAKQKTSRKAFATTAAAVMAATAVTPVAAFAASTTSFPDVPAGEYADAINNLVGKGIINGFDDGTFKPNNPVTREQAAKILATALKLDTTGTENYPDVSPDNWSYEYIVAVTKAGIFGGDENGKFNPSANLTRQQAAKIIVKAFGFKGSSELTFGDKTNIQSWAVPYVKTAVANGILKGDDQGNFNPNANIKRGDFALMIQRALNAVENAKTPKVESVSAINGKLTVKFNKAPEAVPTVNDFKVTQNINGTTKAINPSSVAWDASTKTATLVVPVVNATEVDQNVSYVVGYKETATVSSNSFTVAKVTEVKVESVKALNSTQIEVVYNQEMDEESVEDLTAYSLSDDPYAATPTFNGFNSPAVSSAVLQADKKTVIITLGDTENVNGELDVAGKLDNKTALALKVDKTKVKSVTNKVLEQDAVKVFQISDVTGPVVEKVEVKENGDLVISFNEKLDSAPTAGKVTINGYTYTSPTFAYSTSTGKSTITIAKADLVDTTKAKLETGKSYNIVVEGQEDVYDNVMDKVYASTFTYSPIAEAPKLVSTTAESEKSFVIKFSENVTKADGSPLTVQINKGAKQLVTTTTTALGNGEYRVTLTGTDLNNDVLYDRAKNETSVTLDIYIPAVKDSAGNITAETRTTVTLNKDLTKPAVANSFSDGTKLDVTFTEAPASVTTTNLAAKMYVLDANGVKIPVGASDVTAFTGSEKKFTLTYNGLGLAAGNYTLVIESGAVKDQSLNGGNANDELRIPFVVGTGLANKPVVNSVNANGTPGQIVITFDKPVTYASAANYQNYLIDGAAIPSNSKFTLDATRTTLTIELPEGTFKETKDRLITIKGVRNDNNILMDEYQAVKTVKENEKIKLQSAKIVNGELILTFNENVDSATLATAFDVNDFVVKVEGVVATVADIDDSVDVNDLTKVAKNQLKVDLTGVNLATGTVTIELVNDTTLATDGAGNTVLIDGKVVTATR